jgi:hypothetical protein
VSILSSNNVSLAGEFAVLSQLALRGCDANMTLGRTKSVDILISDPKTDRMIKLEVKTRMGWGETSPKSIFGRTYDWIMHQKHETIKDPSLFYCFVRMSKDGESAKFYIVPSEVVASYVKKEHLYWLKKRPGGKSTAMRMFRLGLDSKGYQLETPLEALYESNWTFKK